MYTVSYSSIATATMRELFGAACIDHVHDDDAMHALLYGASRRSKGILYSYIDSRNVLRWARIRGILLFK